MKTSFPELDLHVLLEEWRWEDVVSLTKAIDANGGIAISWEEVHQALVFMNKFNGKKERGDRRVPYKDRESAFLNRLRMNKKAWERAPNDRLGKRRLESIEKKRKKHKEHSEQKKRKKNQIGDSDVDDISPEEKLSLLPFTKIFALSPPTRVNANMYVIVVWLKHITEAGSPSD
jgi:hypothetical protein